MRTLGYLALVGLLLPALTARADLSEADGLISISARAVPWMVRYPAQGYTLSVQRDRQDEKGQYYMFTRATTGLNVSFYVEPADTCATADACRENYWKTRHPSLADAQGVQRFERNGFALLEFHVEYPLPDLHGQAVAQGHVSGHLVPDGYWVDMHLSLMPYTPSDRQMFLDFVDAIRVALKGQ
jgi:hypothetical protein